MQNTNVIFIVKPEPKSYPIPKWTWANTVYCKPATTHISLKLTQLITHLR